MFIYDLAGFKLRLIGSWKLSISFSQVPHLFDLFGLFTALSEFSFFFLVIKENTLIFVAFPVTSGKSCR